MRPVPPLAVALVLSLASSIPAPAQEPSNGRGISRTFSQRGYSGAVLRAPSSALRVPTGSRTRFPSRSATPNVIRFDGPAGRAPTYSRSSRIIIGRGHTGRSFGADAPFGRTTVIHTYNGCSYSHAPAYAIPTAGTGNAYDATRGWDDIAGGDGYLAMRMFATVCERNQIDSLCKAGFAIGAAMAGRDRQAIFGMRQAVRTNVGALRYAPLDDRIEPRLRALITRYERQATDRRDDSSDLFMVASIKFMLHDNEGAYEALLRADAVGERTDSILALGGALESILDQLETPTTDQPEPLIVPPSPPQTDPPAGDHQTEASTEAATDPPAIRLLPAD